MSCQNDSTKTLTRASEFQSGLSKCFKVFGIIVGLGGISANEGGEFLSRAAEVVIMVIFNSNGCF